MINYKVISLSELMTVVSGAELIEVFKKFSCEVETDLEDFLVCKAIKYEDGGKGKTFLLIDYDILTKENRLVIAAYFTLANTAIDLSNFSDPKKKKVVGDFPGRSTRDNFPAFLIAQLGRCDAYSHEDLNGDAILNECFHHLKNAAEIIGGKLVVLECREHMFNMVYEKLGFHKLVDELNADNLYMLYKRVNFKEY